ncbi:MAG: glycogen debranching enzyme GlgX [Leptothrix sp. (in: Bacteria)]|nr:glycogen debranching enzyme GlgX [Leptothrix sp. (in: b-proteobacteria)]
MLPSPSSDPPGHAADAAPHGAAPPLPRPDAAPPAWWQDSRAAVLAHDAACAAEAAGDAGSVGQAHAAAAPPLPGHAHPLGATLMREGVNFSIYARGATQLSLLLYDEAGEAEPARVIALDARCHRSADYWHVQVPGLAAGQIYAWCADGPHDPARGMRFDADRVLLDPYGRAVVLPDGYSRAAAAAPGRDDARAAKSVVTDVRRYDWEGDAPLHRPFAQTVIYEMHVGGFTRHPNSGLAPPQRGTYAGLVARIPYLLELGITAVELLPVFQFDTQDAQPGLANYWGYSPMSFFAPHAGYAMRPWQPLAVLDEFRDMVKALHRAGLEVILDVVYNHTAEGGEGGPTFSWRGLAEGTYYLLDDAGRPASYSGTGNTLNANNAVVRRMILDSLHYWVSVMHVDGFRFDLAAILSRDERGLPSATPPVILDIDSDPVLAGTKLIAEAWDAAGLYQVGCFAGERWKEWNGQFRDDVRAFVRGDPGMVGRLAHRLCGSPDLYGAKQREPAQSINFVTCHDGFTLNDLVSYERKHNDANGEQGRDGSDYNLSWNCGAEGPGGDPVVEALRDRQVRNLLAITVLALGTPMLLMGDEVRRTQHGNNNAYCQDNETSWFDWSAVPRQAALRRFVAGLIALRGLRESVRREHALTLSDVVRRADVQLHGVRLGQPDFSHDSHSLAISAQSLSGGLLMYFVLNAGATALSFELPPLPTQATPARRHWLRVIDTGRAPPDDMPDIDRAEPVQGPLLEVAARSVVMLLAEG